MSNITCPLCGSAVALRQFFDRSNKPFCARCGWNLDRAESSFKDRWRSLQFVLIILPALAIIFLGLSAKADHGGSLSVVLPVLVFFVLGGAVPIWSYISTKRAIALARASAPVQAAQG